LFFRFQKVGLLLLPCFFFVVAGFQSQRSSRGSCNNSDIKTFHLDHVLHQRTDNASPFVLTSVKLLISSSNLFKSTLPCHHMSSARGSLSPTQRVSSVQNTTKGSAGCLFLSVWTTP